MDSNLNFKSVAIIIPFRDLPKEDGSSGVRTIHLFCLLKTIIPILIKQQVFFKIFVTTQGGPSSRQFNRGKLLNAGYDIAHKEGFDCFVFHDVDILPENDKILYQCLDSALHMSTLINKV